MTIEELHEYNRRQRISDISYESVCKVDFTIELRKWITKWLEQAYEAGFQAAKDKVV